MTNVPVVGDSLRDLQAAQAAKAHPILVKTGNGGNTIQALRRCESLSGLPVFEDRAAFANDLLRGDRVQRRS